MYICTSAIRPNPAQSLGTMFVHVSACQCIRIIRCNLTTISRRPKPNHGALLLCIKLVKGSTRCIDKVTTSSLTSFLESVSIKYPYCIPSQCSDLPRHCFLVSESNFDSDARLFSTAFRHHKRVIGMKAPWTAFERQRLIDQ